MLDINAHYDSYCTGIEPAILTLAEKLNHSLLTIRPWKPSSKCKNGKYIDRPKVMGYQSRGAIPLVEDGWYVSKPSLWVNSAAIMSNTLLCSCSPMSNPFIQLSNESFTANNIFFLLDFQTNVLFILFYPTIPLIYSIPPETELRPPHMILFTFRIFCGLNIKIQKNFPNNLNNSIELTNNCTS